MYNLFQTKMKVPQRVMALLVATLLCLGAALVLASDHADPILLKNPEAGISDLFAFPDGDRLIVILGLRPGLTTKPPYDLEPYSYAIYMDLKSPLSFDSAEDRARYGGTVVKPEGIKANVTIQFSLNDDTSVKEKSITGLNKPEGLKMWTGLRDDPFIFPKFFGTNVIAMSISIPFSSFPADQKDWILWATSHQDGEQIDHVGRSNRTMEPRLNLLNTLHPSEHVKAINQVHDNPTLVEDLAKTLVSPLFAIRQYDFFADVMIFTTRFPVGYPNGRKLRDDVAGLTCEQGNCLLLTSAFSDSKTWPRKTVNDKPFLNKFPYLAEPWPNPKATPNPALTSATKIKLGIIGVIVLLLLLLPWWLLYRCRHPKGMPYPDG